MTIKALKLETKVYFDDNTFVPLPKRESRTVSCYLVFVHCSLATFTEVNPFRASSTSGWWPSVRKYN